MMSKSKQFTAMGRTFIVTLRAADRPASRARMSVFDNPDTDSQEEAIHTRAKELGAPHGWTKRGDFPEIDKMWDVMNRAIVDHKRTIANEAAEALGIEPSMSFSRKAGCSCGCSPGFILKAITGVQFFVEEAPEDTSFIDLAEGRPFKEAA